MKIAFNSSQQYQLDAIRSVVDLFAGQPLANSDFALTPVNSSASAFGFPNELQVSEAGLLENLKTIQQRNAIEISSALDGLHFSVEMETGTGKTYIYLRSIFELHREYGFTKFIIVVPSVAIREGVMTSLRLMEQHFRELYDNVPMKPWVYNSSQLTNLRSFASANTLQLMVMNIDAFNKSSNVIQQQREGFDFHRPIEFIQEMRPIVIMDEPQNMESDAGKAAIASLNPLCTLRFSATHRNTYNLIYKLDPVKAYDLRLVKRIEVDSVLSQTDFNRPYLHLQSISASKTTLKAKMMLDVDTPNGVKRKAITLNHGDDLQVKAGGRSHYAGYVIRAIRSNGIEFTNGVRLSVGEEWATDKDAIMRIQIRNTIREHLEKELRMAARHEHERMKVLSLFFIDRVANYHPVDGKIRLMFIEEYQAISSDPAYKILNLPPVEKAHNGYFSISKDKSAKDTNGSTQADDEAYALIMRDKEKLLQLDEPLRFIFSHSALREGWDNPNVFQICTLAESHSEIKKRQEIGRGMRLPVMANGQRCMDASCNILTVIANESYEDFARKLQSEIEEETGVPFGDGRIADKRSRKKISLKPGWQLNEDFLELWKRIKQKTRYRVAFTTEELVKRSAQSVSDMPAVVTPQIITQRVLLNIDRNTGVQGQIQEIRQDQASYVVNSVPDLLDYLQRETHLTRSTLAAILKQSGRLDDVYKNPQQFMDQALKAIRDTMVILMAENDGTVYEKIDEEYTLEMFEESQLEAYEQHILEVAKSIYNAIEVDSDIERQIAQSLDQHRADIKLLLKLPSKFLVTTPLGNYNPDWAIVKEKDGKLYLVRESKGALGQLELRGSEALKIKFGKKHFKELGVDFQAITSAEQV